MKKTKMTTKALSMLLTVIMLFTTISVGIIVPDAEVNANAAETATFTISSADTVVADIEEAIAYANENPTVKTTIKLGAYIEKVGSVSAFTPITGDIVFDFNQYYLKFIYTGSESNDNNTSYQIPSENVSDRDFLSNALFTINAGGSLQFIDSSNLGTAALQVITDYQNTANTGGGTSISSSNLILNKGTLILGDAEDLTKNSFIISAYSSVRCTSTNLPNINGYKSATVDSYAITVNSSSAIFKMYGGTVNSSGVARIKKGNSSRTATVNLNVVALNVNQCASAEIYGGSINIPQTNYLGQNYSYENTGIYNSANYAPTTDGIMLSAIRCNSSNLFIFDVDSTVYAYADTNTSNSTNMYLSNVYSVDTNYANVYGGGFSFSCDSKSSSSENSSAKINGYTVRGGYNIANYPAEGATSLSDYIGADRNAASAQESSASGSFVCQTLFIHDGGTAYNGLDIFSYSTFAKYKAAVESASASTEVYGVTQADSLTATHHDTNSYSCTTYNYKKNGYTQTGWIGKTHPGGTLSYANTGESDIDTAGGSLFLQPVWTPTVYNITYDFSGYEDKIINSLPSTYTIETDSVIPAPIRNGYVFGQESSGKMSYWLVASVENGELDNDEGWGGDGVLYRSETINLKGKFGHVTLKPYWTLVTYTASFDFNGGTLNGSSETSKSYNINSYFDFPTGVKKDYYSFNNEYLVKIPDGSWSVSSDAYKAGSNSDVGNYGNVTFIAQYTPIEYTVTYNSNGGSSVDDESLMSYNVESTHSLPAVSRTGYKFIGWTPDEESGSWVKYKDGKINTYPAGTTFTNKNGNVTLIAVWESAAFELTLQLDEGNVTHNYAYASTLEITNPTKSGYKFAGWKVIAAPDADTTWTVGETFKPDGDGNTVIIPANRLGDVVLEPMWEPVSYTLSFNSNGGSAASSFTYDIEDSVTLPVITKNGYNLVNWSVSTTEGNWVGTYAAGTAIPAGLYGDTQFVANWEKAEYTVTLDADGGTGVPATLAYNIEANTELPTPTRIGYSFDGWEVTAFGTTHSWEMGDVYDNALPAGQYGDVTLKAKWTHTAYTIILSTIGTPIGNKVYYIDSDAFYLPAASYPGYQFDGWTVTRQGGNWVQGDKYTTASEIKGMYGNVTLTASFSPIEYSIEFTNADGVEAISYDMQTTVSLPTYEKAGYTFGGWRVVSVTDGDGWILNGVCQPGEIEAGTRYGNVVLEPVLTANEYSVTFISDGGTPYADLQYTTESTDTLPGAASSNPPEKAGYDFAGWLVTSAQGNWVAGDTLAGNTSVNGFYGDVTLTAQWTPKTYDITWVIDGESHIYKGTYGELPVYGGETPTKAPDSQYTYTFAGWSPELQPVTGVATYTAVWEKAVNSYTVTWVYDTDDNGNTVTETDTYKYGETPVFKNGANPEKISVNGKYYRFEGWEPTVSPVTENVTYTAIFVEIKAPATVIWVIDSNTSYTTYWEDGTTPYYVPARPDVDGFKYVFSSWSDEIIPVESGETYIYTATFYSYPQTYIATFDLNGGVYSGNTEVEYNRNTGLTMPKPEKAGYSFVGWQITSNGGTWTDTDVLTYDLYKDRWGDVSFVAVYTATEYTISVKDDNTTTEYKYTIESTDTLPQLEKEGYELTSWMIITAEGNWMTGDTVAADKALAGMYGNISVQPVWTAKTYKINWVSGDITQTVEVKYGSAVVTYPPLSKVGYTAQWDNEVPAIMPAEDLTFTAIYSPIQYFLRFNSAGGSEVENFYYKTTSDKTLPVPTRDGATFKGWKVSAGGGSWVKDQIYAGATALEGTYGNATLTAIWELEIHTVTWVAGDVTKVTKWYHGATPSYDGVPYKSPDQYNSYKFIGWDKEIVTVSENVTYTAVFEAVERVYTVRWNIDGYIAQEDSYKYGATPVYNGETPVRASTTEYDFNFAGWTPEVSTVTGDVTYVAQFDVYVKLLGLRIDKTAIFLNVGEEAVVSAIIAPSTATNKDIEWKSQDESIATIDSLGRITAVGAGDVVISVQSKDGAYKAYCVVSVAPIVTEYIVVSSAGVSTTRLPGDAIQLYATVMPANATNKEIKWSSSNTAVATVNEDGLVVFGNATGTATITAMSDGYAAGSIDVTTTKDESQVENTADTYLVMFTQSSSQYIIGGNTYESINIICKKGDTIEFLLTEPHFVTLNAVQFDRDTDGVYRIKNIDKNYTVFATERADIGLEEDEENEPAKMSFFDKLKEFFRSIVEFFRNLFG